jgi:hypothetical protein
MNLVRQATNLYREVAGRGQRRDQARMGRLTELATSVRIMWESQPGIAPYHSCRCRRKGPRRRCRLFVAPVLQPEQGS